jgi:adenosylcobinamide-GDP ribazoletransferase
VNRPWRLFMAALRFMTRRSTTPAGSAVALPHQATRFFPLVGMLIGGLAAGVYWLGAQIWPANVALVLSMLATVVITANLAEESSKAAAPTVAGRALRSANLGPAYWVFSLLVKYNALMALTAAHGPFSLPVYLTLGLIMVAAQAASGGLVVSIMATHAPVALRATTADLSIAVIVGCLPATLLGTPGLAGLILAIGMRLLLTARILPKLKLEFRRQLDVAQQVTEVCFYLGALATWKYV